MRGKGVLYLKDTSRRRITPAYAGKSIRLSSYGLKGWDHPRLCGEKAHKSSGTALLIGSPPPMRGKDRTFPRFPQTHKDHPRLCGEKFEAIWGSIKAVGSPPPMRGKGLCVSSFCKMFRITPAYAGKRGRGLRKPRR